MDLLSTTKNFAPFSLEILFPWAPQAAGFSTAPMGRTARYVIFSPFSWNSLLSAGNNLLLPDMLCKAMIPLGVIGEAASEGLLTWLQSIPLTKTGLLFPLLNLPAGFLLDHSLCGRGIQTLLHYSLAWTGKASPYVFPNVCVHITNWTSELLNQLLWFSGSDKGIRLSWLCHRERKWLLTYWCLIFSLVFMPTFLMGTAA